MIDVSATFHSHTQVSIQAFKVSPYIPISSCCVNKRDLDCEEKIMGEFGIRRCIVLCCCTLIHARALLSWGFR